jgi:glycosyltransferase involved in cell wall biosynthesis
MIVVAELAFNDGGHVPFNAGLLAVVRKAFPCEQVCFFGEPAHIGELKKQVGEFVAESIEWQEMRILPQDLSYISRLLGEMKILRTLLRMYPEGATCLLLLPSARPATLVAFKLVKLFRFKNIKTQIVLHGHFSGVIGRRYRHPVRRFQEMRTALTILGNDNVQYLVLEDNLRDVLLQRLPALSEKVEVLDHPLPPNEAESKTIQLNPPIRFGFLGIANEAKGFPVFVKLAEEITEKWLGQAEFHAIGRFSVEGSPPLRTDVLTTKPGMERLSRADYIQGVKQLHFIVFPHQAYFYDLNSSGTLLDALAWGKPLIARKISIFENFFAKHGDIGYLFSTDRELREIVECMLQRADKIRYDEQVSNIQRAQSSRSPEALAIGYRSMCEKIRNLVP